MITNTCPSKYPTFYVDDSSCEIDGKKHIILATAAFGDEDAAVTRWLEEKSKAGLKPYEEVKWNQLAIPLEVRRRFVPHLNDAVGLVVVTDLSKQEAAILLTTQVWAFCDHNHLAGFRLRFDRDIVSDWPSLRRHLQGFFPPCVGISQADSSDEQLLQAADFLAGAMKLKVDFGLGLRDPNLKILAEGDEGLEEVELGFYFFATLRYCLWGEVKDFGDEQMPSPRKMVLGRGVVVKSSVQQSELDKAVSHLEGDYMGCIH